MATWVASCSTIQSELAFRTVTVTSHFGFHTRAKFIATRHAFNVSEMSVSYALLLVLVHWTVVMASTHCTTKAAGASQLKHTMTRSTVKCFNIPLDRLAFRQF